MLRNFLRICRKILWRFFHQIRKFQFDWELEWWKLRNFLLSNETYADSLSDMSISRSFKVTLGQKFKISQWSKMTFLGSIRLDMIILSLIIPIFTKRSEVTKYQKFWSKITLMLHESCSVKFRKFSKLPKFSIKI